MIQKFITISLLWLVTLTLSGEEQILLLQNSYRLFFQGTGHYLVFNDVKAYAYGSLEWKSNPVLGTEVYYLTIRSQDVTTRFFSSSGETLNFSLYDARIPNSAVTLYDLQNYTQAAILLDNSTNDGLLRFPFKVIAPEKQHVTPGIYSCFLEITLYNFCNKEIATETIKLVTEVGASQKLEFITIGHGAEVELNFCEIIDTTTISVPLRALSNIPYQISILSINRGKLLLQPEWRKPHYSCIEMEYSAAVDGKTIPLARGKGALRQGKSAFANKEGLHILSLTAFPDKTKHWEGLYEDELIIAIEPIY